MAQMLVVTTLGMSRGFPEMGPFAEAIDPEVRGIAHADGPEAPLAIEFVGISESQQRAALAGFPGGQRFTLVQPQGRG